MSGLKSKDDDISTAKKVQYQGEDVTVLRDAAAGDPDFVATSGPQKLVRKGNGMEVAVPAKELKGI
jgi:hypothetical protein